MVFVRFINHTKTILVVFLHNKRKPCRHVTIIYLEHLIMIVQSYDKGSLKVYFSNI